jgi:hypothetical protein
VLGWVRNGILTAAERGSRGRSYRFRVDDAVLERLKIEKDALDQRRALASGAACQDTSQ